MNLIYTKSTKLLTLNFLNRIYEAAISAPEEQSRLHKMLVLFKQNCSTVFSELYQTCLRLMLQMRSEFLNPCDHQR